LAGLRGAIAGDSNGACDPQAVAAINPESNKTASEILENPFILDWPILICTLRLWLFGQSSSIIEVVQKLVPQSSYAGENLLAFFTS